MTPVTRRNALKIFVTTAGLTTVTLLAGESAERENDEVERSEHRNLEHTWCFCSPYIKIPSD